MAAVFILALSVSSPRGHCADLIGQAAPDFTLKSLGGGDVSLKSLSGKVVLINFWATWCTPCRDEMPSMNKLYLKYRDSGLVVLAVSTDDSVTAVEQFVSKNRFEFHVLLDSGKKVSKRTYRINAQPTSFLIDKNGKVIKKYLGSVNWMDEAVQKEITALF